MSNLRSSSLPIKRTSSVQFRSHYIAATKSILCWRWGMGSKTGKNDAAVDKFLAGITDEQRRADCLSVLELMKELTGEPAVMWGKAMVGFGSFRYRGKTSEGDWFHVGFSPRKQNLVLYLHCELEKQTALLEKLGKHTIGKSCLNLKKLEDVHLPTLKKLITKAYKSPAIASAEID